MEYPAYAPSNEIDQAIDQIAQALRDPRQNAEFMLGAGMSVPSGAPTGFQLNLELLKLFFPKSGVTSVTDTTLEELARSLPLELVASAFESRRTNRRKDLTALLRNIFLSDKLQPSKAHDDLVSISMWGGYPRVSRVFTTNFDKILETAFGKRAVEVTDSDSGKVAEAQIDGKIPIIHLHGSLNGDRYQVTEADLFESVYRPTHQQFRSALVEANAFVFVGYSMGDPDFRRLYMEFRLEIKNRNDQGKWTYFVAPSKDAETYAIEKMIWETRGAVWIPLNAESFFHRIKQILDEESDQAIRAAIMAKYGIGDIGEFEAKVDQVAKLFQIDRANAIAFLQSARSKTGD